MPKLDGRRPRAQNTTKNGSLIIETVVSDRSHAGSALGERLAFASIWGVLSLVNELADNVTNLRHAVVGQDVFNTTLLNYSISKYFRQSGPSQMLASPCSSARTDWCLVGRG